MKVLRINQLKLPVGHTSGELSRAVTGALRPQRGDTVSWQVVRRSIDARRCGSGHIYYIYTVDAIVPDPDRYAQRPGVTVTDRAEYSFPARHIPPGVRPVVVGFGPAGMFAALLLAEAGLAPTVIEQGDDVDTRSRKVAEYWAGGELDVRSNVQFGEGGAGTFSDGKLNTSTGDSSGRNRFVLETLVRFGAPAEILTDAMPHIGTDRLVEIVRAIREHIISLGGRVMFRTRLESLEVTGGRVTGIRTDRGSIPADACVLAIGHSSRETYESLLSQGVSMEQKAFACGYRVQHPQSMIDRALYGGQPPEELGPAPYKLTYKAADGRGVYSFCMCPGGYVVDSSSEPGGICVNGMSYSGRRGTNANSAVVVTVRPEEFGGSGPLAGIEFQRRLERAAYAAGSGSVPVQRLEDFREKRPTAEAGAVTPEIKGRWQFGNLRGILSAEAEEAFLQAMEYFGSHRIPGFDGGDTLLAGIEARTSSPVRIPRGDDGQSVSLQGLFPAGEGAGYAGGITSAAMDGMKAAEKAAEMLERQGRNE